MGIKFDVISVCCGDTFKDYDLVNLSAVEWFGLQYGRPDKVTHFGSLAEIKDDVTSYFGDEELVYITFSLGREGCTYETGTNIKRPMYSFGSLDRSSFKTSREMYLDIARTLTEIVKREDENLLERLRKRSVSRRKLQLVTQYGARFVVSFEDVLWVKTGSRWPKGVFELLKGMSKSEKSKEDSSVEAGI